MTPDISPRYRDAFLELRREYPGAVVSPSFLRQDLELDNNKSTYKFNLLSEQAQPALPQRFLSRSDVFVALMFGLFIFPEDDDQKGREKLYTYPNPVAFSGGTPADLEVIYNGAMAVVVDNVTVTSNFWTRKFRQVPETQERATYTLQEAGANVAGAPAVANDQQNPFDGLIEMPGRYKLFGRKKNEFRLEIPTYTGIDLDNATSGTTNKVALILDGFLLEGIDNGV